MKRFLILMSLILLIVGCAEQPAVKSDVQETASSVESEPAGEVEEPAEMEPATHEIKITDDGFEPLNLNIKSGDKVVWKNVRTGRYTKAQILGTRNCLEIKSKIFGAGEEFSWVFNEPRSCIMIDGITQTDNGKIIVEAKESK